MDYKIIAKGIFLAGINSVLPDRLIQDHVKIKGATLFISSFQFSLDSVHRIFVIGAGKASALMANEIEKILGDRITNGLVVTKYGHGCKLKNIEVVEAGHPIPDNNGLLATQKILESVQNAKEGDLIICLISGGGSALLADIPEEVTLNDIIMMNNLLLRSGANIKEINTVRKHVSKVKGGQLAKAAHPAFLVSLILSDVIGDPLDSIASGPTVPDTTTFQNAIDVLIKYQLLKKIPKSILNYLNKGIDGIYPETPKPGDSIFDNTKNIIIGNNKIALEATSQNAKAAGLTPAIITSTLEGDTVKAAELIITKAIQFQKDTTIKKPCCLLFGGETTLNVIGNGIGGRNQHLALHAAWLLKTKKGITLLAGGTDGNDGPTSVAGAIVDSNTWQQALDSGAEPENYLANFDSFHFFEKVGGHIITGPTMTNVMDLIVVVIE